MLTDINYKERRLHKKWQKTFVAVLGNGGYDDCLSSQPASTAPSSSQPAPSSSKQEERPVCVAAEIVYPTNAYRPDRTV
jgi:hypothetical protein